MLDVAPTELLLVAAVALIVIGPKDLPRVMRTVGRWVGKARGVASHFRSGFDQMVRDAELEEMQKRWADENARIMREHPAPPEAASLPAPLAGEEPPGVTDAGEDRPAVAAGVPAPAEDSQETPVEATGGDAPEIDRVVASRPLP